MKTIGDEINNYKQSFKLGNEGSQLLQRAKEILSFDANDETKINCFNQEIDIIISAFIENAKDKREGK